MKTSKVRIKDNTIRKYIRQVDNMKFMTVETDFCSHNTIEVEVGTTGYEAGTNKYDVKTYFRISDTGGTQIEAKSSPAGVEVFLEGESELYTITEALKFIVSILEKQEKGELTNVV